MHCAPGGFGGAAIFTTLLNIWTCWVRDGWAVVSLHYLLPLPRLLLGLVYKYSWAVGFSESSTRAPKKASDSASTGASSRSKRGCSGKSLAVAALRIMSRTRGSAAMRRPRCAGRATLTDLLQRTPEWPVLSAAWSVLSSVNPERSLRLLLHEEWCDRAL